MKRDLENLSLLYESTTAEDNQLQFEQLLQKFGYELQDIDTEPEISGVLKVYFKTTPIDIKSLQTARKLVMRSYLPPIPNNCLIATYQGTFYDWEFFDINNPDSFSYTELDQALDNDQVTDATFSYNPFFAARMKQFHQSLQKQEELLNRIREQLNANDEDIGGILEI